MKNIVYLLIGTFFGIVMYKSEAASWFRIYEMFQFQSIHMYGLMGTALAVGIIVVQYIKRNKVKNINGEPINIADKDKSIPRYLIGGILFGLGWALAGACPGPMFVMTGAGYFPILVVILGAVLGTWLYGLIKDKLPH
ncbi:YeeE/YedE family protein [Pseudopedobacter beijingensis]|uniref:YeeE/YedE family protein n=1 Tax=Pseudopedobacter beijingensis TaxID=1207056 RepID=A0ABW4ICX4_9SPHI